MISMHQHVSISKFFNFILDIIHVLLSVFQRSTDTILDVCYWIIYGRTKPLPPIDNKILLMSATELAQKIRKRELSAVKVMETYIQRIKEVQPILNAYIDERFEDALTDARRIDKIMEAEIRSERELAKTKPLLGVPFSCKEIIGVKGLASTWGLPRFKDRKAAEDAYATAQYRKAGAIPVVVTNIPTMSMWWDTENPVFGATKNPYNNNRTAGGSSGGEAALIASAGSVIGIGSDFAGSIRIPSSFCGIYGHKPSAGIISNKANIPDMSNSLSVIQKTDGFMSTGPMCRYAEDLTLLLKVMCADDDCKKLRLDEKVDFRKVTVYYMEQLPGIGLSATPDVRASVRKAVKSFEEKYNSTAIKLEIEELKHGVFIWQSKIFELGVRFRTMRPEINGFFKEIWEMAKCILGISEVNLRLMYHAGIEFREKTAYYEKCLDMYKVIEKKLIHVLDENAILIVPVHPEPAPHPITTIPKFQNVAYTCIFNILGLPVTVVPAGQSKKGLPIGLQITGRKYNDHLTIAAAAELDKVFGGWKNPPTNNTHLI